jgi:ribonuclease P protein component
MGNLGFPRHQRLTSRNDIQDLFKEGDSFMLFPFKVLARTNPTQSASHKILISVSKRNFKRAVDRNLIKRRIREAYRTNKHRLPESPKLQIAYLYVAREILGFDQIEGKLIESIDRLHQYAKKN